MKYIIRSLNEKDREQVEILDELSGNYLSQWLDGEGYAWGIFIGKELIGYCSIGYADDVCSVIENYEGYTCDSLLLSDVYIKKEYRRQGYALKLIDKAIRERTKLEKELVFLTLLYDNLSYLYKQVKFKSINNYIMVRDERN